MTKARKLRIWTLYGGLCDGCGCAVPVYGPTVEYDHRITFWTKPELDDDGPNVRPLCVACHTPKTAGDAKERGHTKRLIAKHNGTARKPNRTIASRPFGKSSRKIASRGFERRAR